MKKSLILMTIFMVIGLALQAQDNKKEAFKSKRGVYILPQAGDIALGFNASPFLKYVGNMMNGHSDNSLNYSLSEDNAIVGKYFLTDTRAIRGELRIGYYRDKNQEFVMKDGTDPFDEVLVTDKQKFKKTDLHLAGGYEWRRGHGRVQGYYGAMTEVQYEKAKVDYTYGNPITSTYTTPTTTDFGNNLDPFRVTEVSNLQKLAFGVRGFIGVEYFFAPKIALAAEFGWGPKFNLYRSGHVSYEYWNGESVETETVDIAKDSEAKIDTDTRGQIVLLFHF